MSTEIELVQHLDEVNKVVSAWFEKRRKSTFIKIDPEYSICKDLQDWPTPPLAN